MFVLARTLVYATIFVGLVLVFVPGRLLSWSGVERPAAFGLGQLCGVIVALLGAGLVLWTVRAFAFVGKGTPAPFDAPRRLVVAGPYRYCRNPMYIGAVSIMMGASLYYRSLALLAYAALLVLLTHLFVVFYEEPTLRRSFGDEYLAYCAAVRRWRPRRRPFEPPLTGGH